MEEEKLFTEERLRKVFDKVFDKETIAALHELARKKFFDKVEFVISTGKEANVYRAIDNAGNYRAVKIYKTKVVEFKQLKAYIEDDVRFAKIKNNRQQLIYAWAKKEFKNLISLSKANVSVPMPLAVKDNILVMEFIGNNGIAAKTLKEEPLQDVESLLNQTIENLALMISKAGIIHADLSEYNMLNLNEKIIIIDCAQAVLMSHPKAKEFLERDLKNMTNYISKQGLKITTEELREKVKARMQELKKQT